MDASGAPNMSAPGELVDIDLLLGLWQQEPRKQVIDRLSAVHGSLCLQAQQALVWLLQHDPVLQALPVREHYLGRLVKQIVIAAEDEGLELDDQLVEMLHAQLMHNTKMGSPWAHRTYYYSAQPSKDELWQLSCQHAATVPVGEHCSSTNDDSQLGEAILADAEVSDAAAAGLAVAKSSVANLRRRSIKGPSSNNSSSNGGSSGCGGKDNVGGSHGSSSGGGGVPSGVMTLWVSDNLFEGGTGCHPWEAGFRMAEFVLSNPELFAGRCCLELGCGSGLVGVSLVRAGAAKVVLTDGDPMAVTNCCRNLRLNGMAAEVGSASCSGGAGNGADSDYGSAGHDRHHTQPSVCCCQMTWEDPEPGLSADVILGADILYDPKVVPSLLALLKQLLTRCQQQQGHSRQQCPTSQPSTEQHHQHQGEPACEPTQEATTVQNGEHATGGSPDKHGNGTCKDSCGASCQSMGVESMTLCDSSTTRTADAATPVSRPAPVAYLATTLRNEQTMLLFETQAAQLGLHLEEVPGSRGHDRLQFQQVVVLNEEVRERIRLHQVTLC